MYPHRNAWANSHILGQPDTFLAAALRHAVGRAPRAPAGALATGRAYDPFCSALIFILVFITFVHNN
jgi:hypothetical protein